MVQMLNGKPKLQQLKIKPFKIGGWEMRSDEYGTYFAWVKEEKEMKETNLQHYKEELKKMFNENYTEPGNIVFKIKKEIDESIETDCYYSSYTNDILDWMARPYEEKILDDVERKYLSDVIRPFRNRVTSIEKRDDIYEEKQFIIIVVGHKENVNLPYFRKATKYKGMKADKKYTLEDLGL